MVESGVHDSVKFSGQWPQQQWSVSYWQLRGPPGATQSWPGVGGSGGHSGQIVNVNSFKLYMEKVQRKVFSQSSEKGL